MNIVEAVTSDKIFMPLFKDLKTWESWIVFLKALFALPITSRKERKLLERCTGLKTPPARPAKEAYVIAGRRSGKSFISSVIACFLACFKDWRPFLAPGERGHVFIVAVDKKQAAIIKGYIGAILHSSRIFERMIERETSECIDLTNNVSIMIKTASYRSIRGYAIVTCILEEISFFRWESDSANPDREILNAIRPALATIPQSLLIGISTPYSRSGVLWEEYRSHFGKSEKEAPLIWKAETRTMNPTISKKIIDDALKEDYAAAKAEWLAEFREDIEAFLSLELIESVVVPGRYELQKMSGVSYQAFCDPSGGRQDSMTLAVSHKDSSTGKVILDCLREARPPFVPKDVVEDFSQVLRSYGISMIQSDSYSAEWVSSSFRDHGIMIGNSELSASEIYLNFLPLISNGSVELLDSKRLAAQLRGLERKTRSGGRDLVTHYPGAHDDVSVSAAGSLVLASRVEYRLPPPSLGFSETSSKQSLEEAAVDWLLDRPRKKSEDEELEEEMRKTDEEIERELEDEEKSEDVIKRGW